MAEAHSAVAFSFTVTHEGVNLDLNYEAIRAIWRSGVRSWKKRMGRMKVSHVMTSDVIATCGCPYQPPIGYRSSSIHHISCLVEYIFLLLYAPIGYHDNLLEIFI